jgi:hypothetical protein
MDLDWLIVIARALTIAGAAAVLIGLITMARPIAAIGLGSRKRPAWRRWRVFVWPMAASCC